MQKSQKNWEKGLDHKNQKTKFQISKRKNQKFSMKGKITKNLRKLPLNKHTKQHKFKKQKPEFFL